VSEGPTILVVDDDDDCRSIIADLLEMSGYAVLCCGSAPAAIDLARRHNPGLILADFVMPGADGAWLIQSLRAEGGALADVPVVLTTGSSVGREIAASLGIHALEKPFDMNRLLDVVRRTARISP
jgi:CheY-like chemotaxis protein